MLIPDHLPETVRLATRSGREYLVRRPAFAGSVSYRACLFWGAMAPVAYLACQALWLAHLANTRGPYVIDSAVATTAPLLRSEALVLDLLMWGSLWAAYAVTIGTVLYAVLWGYGRINLYRYTLQMAAGDLYEARTQMKLMREKVKRDGLP